MKFLDDLDRYRTVIEDEDIQDPVIWAGVACLCYNKAPDRNQTIGRGHSVWCRGAKKAVSDTTANGRCLSVQRRCHRVVSRL